MCEICSLTGVYAGSEGARVLVDEALIERVIAWWDSRDDAPCDGDAKTVQLRTMLGKRIAVCARCRAEVVAVFGKGGYDADGFDRYGFNRAGYDRDGYDRDGRDRDGYDTSGYDRDGYDRHGHDWLGLWAEDEE